MLLKSLSKIQTGTIIKKAIWTISTEEVIRTTEEISITGEAITITGEAITITEAVSTSKEAEITTISKELETTSANKEPEKTTVKHSNIRATIRAEIKTTTDSPIITTRIGETIKLQRELLEGTHMREITKGTTTTTGGKTGTITVAMSFKNDRFLKTSSTKS